MLKVAIQKKLGGFDLNVSFELENGVLGLLGASGCGKSMTLRCIAGIDRPDHGIIELDGETLFDARRRIDVPPQRRRVGYLFQHYALFPNMTVEGNIAAGIPAPKAQRARLVAEKIAAFRLQGLERLRPPQLSGGQQQRVALARLLASQPRLLLLDEPFSALDSHLKWKLEQEMMDVLAAFPGAALMVSHNRDEIYRLCDQVAIYAHGKLDALGPMQAIFDRPGTYNSALLTGCKNVSRVQPTGEYEVLALDWGVALRTAEPVPKGLTHVGIRAHCIDILPQSTTGQPNAFPADVCREVASPFSAIVLTRSPQAADGEAAILRIELDPARWQALRAPNLMLALPPEHLLLLRE